MIKVGSRVRHIKHGKCGVVVRHDMYDGLWGGFGVEFDTPLETSPGYSISKFFDRADKWQLLAGSITVIKQKVIDTDTGCGGSLEVHLLDDNTGEVVIFRKDLMEMFQEADDRNVQ